MQLVITKFQLNSPIGQGVSVWLQCMYMCMCVCMYNVYLQIYLNIYSSLCYLSIQHSIYPSIYLSIHLSIYIHVFIYLFIYPCIRFQLFVLYANGFNLLKTRRLGVYGNCVLQQKQIVFNGLNKKKNHSFLSYT